MSVYTQSWRDEEKAFFLRINNKGYSHEYLERVRAAKAAERGALERKILLKEVTEK